MYQQIYTWMNSHFLILSVVVLVLLFVLAALSERFRENCGIKFIYHMGFEYESPENLSEKGWRRAL